MKITHILASLAILAAPLNAESLDDLRAYLKAHPGQAPIRMKISCEFQQSEGRKSKAATGTSAFPLQLVVSDGPSGFQIVWDPKVLANAPENSVAEDLWLMLPNVPHGSTAWLDPICLYRTTNPARSLQRLLDVAKVEEDREVMWNGQPTRRLTLKFKAPLPERFQYRFRGNRRVFPTGNLTVWLASDGAPLASEVTMQYRVGLGLLYGDFARKTTQKTTYQSSGDRIISSTQHLEDETDIERHTTRTVIDLKIEKENP